MTAATKPRKVRTLRAHALVADLMAEISKLAIAQRIAAKREESGLTQHELAELLHVHTRTVQNWESQTDPKIELRRLGDIGQALSTSQFWLLHGAELPGSAEDAATLAEILVRLQALEEKVDAQTKATARGLASLARDVRALAPPQEPRDRRAKKAAGR